MSSIQKSSEDKKIEKLDSSKELTHDDFEKELDNYQEKKKSRYSVYTHRILKNPKITDANSVFEFNMLDSTDFLKKKHLFIISKYEQILLISSDINKKLEENSKAIEELNEELIKLKEEKKKKQADIVNYLSNKESLEEIYKNKLKYIIKQKEAIRAKLEEKEINLNLDSSGNQEQEESQYYDIDQEKEIEIKIEEIKKSDQAKFTEQIINLVEEIFHKKEEKDLIEKIKSKIKIAYNIFFSELTSNITINNESIISHFFSRIGLFISNHSLGLYSDVNINKFLRYLLKINSTNVEILQTMKFLNKKYKEQKGEIKNKINNLKEENEKLKKKKNVDDIKIEKYEKIIQKNKELMNNAKQNENNDENNEEKKEKRRYTVHISDRSRLKKGNNATVGNNEEVINQSDIKNKPKKSKFFRAKEKKINNKNNDEAFNSSQSDENKNIKEKSGENDSKLNSKNNEKMNLNNQKVIVIKNNINIKDNEENNEINDISSNNNNQNIKYNENIYIINNINNSEQVQTKNNIYDKKSNNININSNNNYNDKSQITNRKINYPGKNDNPNINNKNSTYNNSQGISQVNKRKNNFNSDNLNKKPDNVMNNNNTGYKITVCPKRSEKKAE